MFTYFFTSRSGDGLGIGQKCDTARFGKFFHFLLDRGVYIAPSQSEAGFVSAAHSKEDIQATVAAAREFFESAR
jgi:glutamate-1-semialdehyde 2,1-aminomutase